MTKPVELAEIAEGIGIWTPYKSESTLRISRMRYRDRTEYTVRWRDFFNCDHAITGSSLAELRTALKPYITAWENAFSKSVVCSDAAVRDAGYGNAKAAS
jgi:hypothetical protein